MKSERLIPDYNIKKKNNLMNKVVPKTNRRSTCVYIQMEACLLRQLDQIKKQYGCSAHLYSAGLEHTEVAKTKEDREKLMGIRGQD